MVIILSSPHKIVFQVNIKLTFLWPSSAHIYSNYIFLCIFKCTHIHSLYLRVHLHTPTIFFFVPSTTHIYINYLSLCSFNYTHTHQLSSLCYFKFTHLHQLSFLLYLWVYTHIHQQCTRYATVTSNGSVFLIFIMLITYLGRCLQHKVLTSPTHQQIYQITIF